MDAKIESEDTEIEQAFKKWRGERPTSGYGKDRYIGWDCETDDLRKCWKAAINWVYWDITEKEDDERNKRNT